MAAPASLAILSRVARLGHGRSQKGKFILLRTIEGCRRPYLYIKRSHKGYDGPPPLAPPKTSSLFLPNSPRTQTTSPKKLLNLHLLELKMEGEAQKAA